jgi:glutamate-1-semialdehyde 2,1-aminomutase
MRYTESENLLQRALQSIPLGSQTFSKSITQYPRGVSPLFIERGKGSHVWDPDGNEYVDFVNSLCAVNLGYCDPDVDEAVQRQMRNGVSFSLPHRLEMEVSELLIDIIPCAEMVRFGKNGSDSTSAAIRIARAYTSRDRIAVCGYHGWQDWYIGSTACHLGVPDPVRNLTHSFAYNDISSLRALLEAYPGEFAAIILEPMNVAFPADGFLSQVRDLATTNGSILIFDETITGFRFSLGGAQEEFGVTPDMATFGKGIANGYPLSAVVGRTDLMHTVAKIFYSGTFGGETLSLAAAKAVIQKIRNARVIPQLRSKGEAILKGVQGLIARHGCEDFLSISGHPTWTFLNFQDAKDVGMWEIKTLFLQEIFARGFLTIGTHNVSFAHSEDDILGLLKAYDEIFSILRSSIDSGSVRKMLKCDPLVPLFRVR